MVSPSDRTIRLHRVLATTPEKVYRAFTDADAMTRSLPPEGFTAKVHHMEAKPGGTSRMSFTNFTTGHSHAFGGEYLGLTPFTRLSYTDRFDDPGLSGEMRVTVELKKVSYGTELNIEQSGIPDVIPIEACYLGWPSPTLRTDPDLAGLPEWGGKKATLSFWPLCPGSVVQRERHFRLRLRSRKAPTPSRFDAWVLGTSPRMKVACMWF